VPTAETLKAVFWRRRRRAGLRRDPRRPGVNEVKLRNALHAVNLEMASDDVIRRIRAVAGFASPIGLRGVTVAADGSAATPNLVAGANEAGYHYRNSNLGRDWQATIITDIALARAGDACPRCGTPLEQRRGIEMGHVFKLGTVYTERWAPPTSTSRAPAARS
jgi:prolyl-tRNA synthetase